MSCGCKLWVAVGAEAGVLGFVLDGLAMGSDLVDGREGAWRMVYLVIMRVYFREFGIKMDVVLEGREISLTVVGRAERRRVEFWSQDCAVGR